MINGQFFAVLIVALTLPIYAQTANEKLARKYACSKDDIPQVVDYFDNLAETNKKWSTYYYTLNESSTKLRLPFCWEGCARNLVKPYYSPFAKNANVFGRVEVQAVADETGRIIFARALNKKPFLSQASEKAACYSKFVPILLSGQPMKFSWEIIYNFILP